MPGGGKFDGLTPADGRVLAGWLAAAKTSGIEMASDFTPRRWQAARPDVVIGVFETGRTAASWMVVRSRGRWAVATVQAGTVSDARVTLADALRLIRA